ncbi:helix-turn-helix domain-containing protein [Cyclobacterium sp. 1_MG-2023]|uniref:helix-turn-helix domain-containing protein n=1 Tax=Cyclobacterium sp. 1_MG-2023 TaxID=3062681 RepID=UPI0026E20738|nr:helix-turn-helix domain-containing protein [Cyclobacterium sp. 1_MG-2023]MDO6439751.1 helix-turn-helix domain-containing protein [Cyclobacterium sp. 1_MG-2023]
MTNLILSTYTPEELTGIIHKAIREVVKDIQPQNSTQPSETLLTRRETADKLKISLVTLNDWTKRGIIQSYLIGGRVLYKDSEIEASLHKTQTVKY